MGRKIKITIGMDKENMPIVAVTVEDEADCTPEQKKTEENPVSRILSDYEDDYDEGMLYDNLD